MLYYPQTEEKKMELRVLEYFLAVAREQSITAAADFLHLTQPTLSRQLRELEEEFGKQLFLRGSRKVTLTEAGVYFRQKAEEIVTLARRAEEEMKNTDKSIRRGYLYRRGARTDAIRNIVSVARDLQKQYGGIRFHIISGDTADLTDRLDKGLFDFCLLLGEIDQSKYEYLDFAVYGHLGGSSCARILPLRQRKPLKQGTYGINR